MAWCGSTGVLRENSIRADSRGILSCSRRDECPFDLTPAVGGNHVDFGELARPRGVHQKSSSQIRHTGLSVPGVAITGPCNTGNGGVFLSLCSIMSNARGTFFPSNFTSKE